MHLVEIFLPLNKGSGAQARSEEIHAIVKELADRFGGATAFTREPADGLWKQAADLVHDRIIIVEVVVERIDEEWWRAYRRHLEAHFEQSEVMIRVTACRLI